MRKLLLLVGVVGIGLLSSGCNPPTPEEEEAAKYPKVKVNTPEEDKAMRERLHLGQPMQGASTAPGTPGNGASSK